ncbi:MAG: hypothetical protein KJ697_04280 [Nanoarchaeota archaeon]|nr:hypothetical protein [Nanoarchaeota archaeon]MBU4124336.1 hypothetical protein [Nanoarchaeota archaeon]
MKGISKFFGMFLNIMQIIFIIIGLFAIFINITTFGYSTEFVAGTRESVMVMQAVLSAPCLTVIASDGYPIRALFDETKLISETTTIDAPSCISYRQDILIEVTGHGDPIIIGNPEIGTIKHTQYPAALKTIEGTTVPVHVDISVGSIHECTKAGQYVCMTGEYGNEIILIPDYKMYSTVYRGKCVTVDNEFVIQRNTVENCNVEYYADKNNVCTCQYVEDNAICTYPGGNVPDAKWACTKVD